LFFALVICAAALVLVVDRARSDDSAVISRLYFLPFNTETFVPVTMDRIEAAALVDLVLVNPQSRGDVQPFVKTLRGMMVGRVPAGRLNELAIRLKLVLEGKTYYVDARGTVLEAASGRTFRLEKSDLNRIESSIHALTGAIDMKAFSRAHGGLTEPK